MSMQAEAIDEGKLMRARLPGNCAECGGTIVAGQTIYFSRTLGSRHKQCVDRGDAAGATAAPRASTAPRGEPAGRDRRDDAPLFDAPRAAYDDAARAARDGAPAAAADDAYTAFGRAGDRDAVRRELAEVIELLMAAMERGVAALERIAKVLR